jgi:hypothetical protein
VSLLFETVSALELSTRCVDSGLGQSETSVLSTSVCSRRVDTYKAGDPSVDIQQGSTCNWNPTGRSAGGPEDRWLRMVTMADPLTG